jgi:hypothetical protein
MLDAIDVRQGAGDQEFGHGTLRPLRGYSGRLRT